ncbi:MAG: site-specific tyrosine recombinase XerC [Deltaproteobacteria bacterium]|nr:site-specific tyrosine recombinase XerC [Deltaproteobacteria bacterium]
MPKKGVRRPPRPLGDLTDPHELPALGEAFLAHMAATGMSPATIKSRRFALRELFSWLDERGTRRPADVTRAVLLRYRAHVMSKRRHDDDRPLALQSRIMRLLPVKAFFRFLVKEGYLTSNPASDLELPKLKRGLPRHVLTVEEVEKILAVPDTKTALGLRDRAILEVLYSSGLRRSELIALKLDDVDAARGLVAVRMGKGGKARVVPIGARALEWISRYLDDARAELGRADDDGSLFLSSWGGALGPNTLTALAKRYVDAAGVKKGSCHLFRHTMATQMLEHGADVRFIQEMLGHALLETTQIYTKVSVLKLKEVHARTHPASLPRPTRVDDDSGSS